MSERRGAIRVVREDVPFGSHARQIVLGRRGSEFFDRAAESLGRAKERKTLPIEEKESFRWLEGYRLACQLAAECPGTQIVSVADCEADIYRSLWTLDSSLVLAPSTSFVPRKIAAVAWSAIRNQDRRAAAKSMGRRELPENAHDENYRTCIDPVNAARQAYLEIMAISVQVKSGPQKRRNICSR